MNDRGMSGSSGGCSRNRRKSAINGLSVPRWNGISDKGWVVNRFFKFRTGGLDARSKDGMFSEADEVIKPFRKSVICWIGIAAERDFLQVANEESAAFFLELR